MASGSHLAVRLEGTRDKMGELIEEYGLDRFEEALTRLELALEDEGWNRLGAQTQYDFSRTGLKKIVEIARAMFLVNPLINHGVLVQTDYVWAQGVSITPKAELLNPVISKFLDHRGNKREFTGHQARMLKEISAQTDGNLFLALFTNPSTGFVRLRSVPIDEISQIITNPEDNHEPWLYRRQWTAADPKDRSGIKSVPKEALYPDWLYRPKSKPAQISNVDVMWDAPIYHVKVGGTENMQFGVPEVYAALDWARAVVQTLEDYATIRRAHARFAWKFNTKGPKGVAAAKSRLGTTLSTDANETNPAPVTGSTWIQADGTNLEPMKTAGGAAPPDEARRMWLMVSGGLGIPETMLSGDATVGNYATAKSLDRPTELKMRDRQTLWSEVIGDILGYVLDQAALCPNGPLTGKKVRDPYTDDSTVQIIDPDTKQPIDRRIDITFPPILLRDIKDRIEAIMAAYALAPGAVPSGLLDVRTAMRLVLVAIGEENVDETLANLLPPNDPNPPIDPEGITPPSAPSADPTPSGVPATPNDTTVPNPGGPVDSPTMANAEALREALAEGRKEDRERGEALVQSIRELAEMQATGARLLAEAVAQRPVDVDVQVTMPEQAPQPAPVTNVIVPEAKRRRITRTAKFVEREGKIIGKTETETEEVAE